jgi:putative exosortase-associated protein (TIGR04073 family)
MEIFKGMQEVDRNENGVAAVAWGPVYGLGNAISRTAAGAFETLTFPFPTTADKDYDPILEPEFVLERHSDTVLSDPVTR